MLCVLHAKNSTIHSTSTSTDPAWLLAAVYAKEPRACIPEKESSFSTITISTEIPIHGIGTKFMENDDCKYNGIFTLYKL